MSETATPRLRLTEPDDGGGEPRPLPNTESFLPQSTVLIVDDNPQNVELLQAFLESLPVRIVTAFDGVEALAKVAEYNPDLILLDVMMPQMSGFQVCRKLKSDPATKDVQVLMVTALNELGDIEQATECGTDDFVSKPVNKFELLTRVKSLLRVRHLKSELERALTYLTEVEEDVTFYACPNHPEVEQDMPGTCPRCGTPLVPKD
ncbi:MAG: response regulator containing a CheY-like receiver domain and a domain [Phycisphaerales bacterium]|nr:response regulator containing a CheY-like receiver domain and a domain [Phycisphaerales bacterium]